MRPNILVKLDWWEEAAKACEAGLPIDKFHSALKTWEFRMSSGTFLENVAELRVLATEAIAAREAKRCG